MSLTESQAVFASIHEDAVNDLLTAFCTDRPRYLVYGSPAFVPATTVSETTMPAIAFPGVPGGIQWFVKLSIPHVDLFKQTAPLPPELSLSPGQFSMSLGVELCLECRRIKPDRREDDKPSDDGHSDNRNERPQLRGEPTCCRLEVFATGHLQRVMMLGGEDALTFVPDAVEIVDIQPQELESVIECLLFMILQAVLAEIRLPLRALRAGAFQLALTQGPLIEDDQVKVRGAV
jgi:hypothetical protein